MFRRELVAIGLLVVFAVTATAADGQELDASEDGLSSAAKFVREHVWVIVLAALGVSFLICLMVFCCCSSRSAQGYAPIEGNVADGVYTSRFELSHSTETFGDMLQKQREKGKTVEEESALLNCQFYLRTLGGYTMKSQLRQIGGRAGKRWYVITDTKNGKEMIMSMLGRPSTCPLTLTKNSVRTIQELMSALRHAYLLPVLHVDYIEEQDLVTFIQPRMPKGSIKDLIYSSKPDEVVHQKYQLRGKPLSEGHVRTYGRQVLEALIFLRSRGFPPCLHLHSANVFVESRSCMLSGYEQTVFGFPSRMYPMVRRAVKDDMDQLEVVLFGHLLFEMLVGHELNVPKAEHHHISEARSSSQGTQVLREIFLRTDNTLPTLTELRDNMFFSGADVSDLTRFNTPPPLNSQMKQVLKIVRKGKAISGASGTSGSGSSKGTKKRSSMSGKSSRPSSRSNANSASPRPAMSPGPAVASPPPPPAAAAPSVASNAASPRAAPAPSTPGRGALLSQIHKGARLKKASTNDRSAPKV